MEDNDVWIGTFPKNWQDFVHTVQLYCFSKTKKHFHSSSCSTDIPLRRTVKKSWSLACNIYQSIHFLRIIAQEAQLWPEVELRFCPRLLLNQYWSGGSVYIIQCTCSDGQEWEEAFFWPIAFCHLCCDIQTSTVWHSKEGRPQVRLRSKDLRLCTAQRMTLKKLPRTTHAVHVPYSHYSPFSPLLYNTWTITIKTTLEAVLCRRQFLARPDSCIGNTYNSYL